MNQEELLAAFNEAILAKNFSAARDFISRIEQKVEEKKGLYMQLMFAAREEGECFMMQEVSIFANFTLTDQDYKRCALVAQKKGDLINTVRSRMRLPTKLSKRELDTLNLQIDGANAQALPHRQALLLKKLREIIRHHIPDWKLTEEQRLVLWLSDFAPPPH